ncbi:hypothetical protein RPO35_01695 [Staphylococcus hominis]|nr:hypothetical protein [Staphylococcus hominis]
MTIETERIYEITRDKFHGVFQRVDNCAPMTDEWPTAVIEWENELKEVYPHQVRFKEEQ